MTGAIKNALSKIGGDNDRYTFRFFLITFFSSTLLIVGVSTIIYFNDYFAEINHGEQRERDRIELMSKTISSFFYDVTSDLLITTEAPAIHSYLETQENKDLQNFSDTLLVLAQSRRIYDQVRYLDNTGKEMIRINKVNDNFYEVPKSALQDKSSRYYFREANNLKRGEVFVSPFDLNIENNQIELPEKPMIRFVAPVFDANGEREGIIILNALGDALLKKLDNLYQSDPGNLLLANREGYFMEHPDPNMEWGFMYPERKNHTLEQLEPELWKRVHVEHSGQFLISGDLYSFTQIFPVATLRIPNILQKNTKPFTTVNAGNDYHWHVASFVPKEDIHIASSILLYRIAVANVFIIFLLSLFSFILAKNISSRRVAENNISKLYTLLKTINRILRHDIRNKLMKVKYAMEMNGGHKKNEWLTAAYNSAQEGIDLVDNMKQLETLAEKGDTTLEIISSKKIMLDVIAKYPIPIKVKGTCRIMADTALSSAFDNIIRNAIMHGKTKKMDIHIKRVGDECEIRMTDYGKGIPEKIQKDIFKEGFKFGKTGNTGLGLYIVHETMKRYGGSVSVEKSKPKGATFILKIPAAKK